MTQASSPDAADDFTVHYGGVTERVFDGVSVFYKSKAFVSREGYRIIFNDGSSCSIKTRRVFDNDGKGFLGFSYHGRRRPRRQAA